MNRLIILAISLFFLNQCSFNNSSSLWQEKEKEKNIENKKDIEILFSENKKITTEFNQELKLNLAKIKTNNKVVDKKNNYGFQDYNGSINKIGNYKFSKLEDINQLNFKPIFLKDGLIFFDKKGSIIRYNNKKKFCGKKIIIQN